MANISDLADALPELGRLSAALDWLDFPDTRDGYVLAETRDRVVRTIETYLIPRARDPQTPMLVVFAGPTGAGKSTLLNSVAGADLSLTGPLRPTTKVPVVFARERRDEYQALGGVDTKIILGRAPILTSMTLVDTPDIDSAETEHRAIAEAVIDAADLVVFVTSANRYADLIPWEVLRRARSRGAPVLNVLNRLRPDSDGALFDYRRRLADQGLGEEVIAVSEHRLPIGGQSIPPGAIRTLRRRLVDGLKERTDRSAQMIRSVLTAALDQTADIVAEAEMLASRRTFLLERIASISPSLDRILAEIQLDVLSALRFDESVGDLSGRSGRRVGWWVWRKALRVARDSAVATQVTQSLIATIESDLRRMVDLAMASLPDSQRPGPTPVSAATYETLTRAVEHWVDGLGRLVEPRARRYLELCSVLLAGAVIGDLDRHSAALSLVAPGMDADRAVAEARSLLQSSLGPIYQTVRSRFGRLLLADYPETGALGDCLDSLRAVVARSSFAHAG